MQTYLYIKIFCLVVGVTFDIYYYIKISDKININILGNSVYPVKYSRS